MTTLRAGIIAVLGGVCAVYLAGPEPGPKLALTTIAVALLILISLVIWSFTRPSTKFSIRINQLPLLHETLDKKGKNDSFMILFPEDKDGEVDDSAALTFAKIEGEVGLEWNLSKHNHVNVRDAVRFQTLARSMGIELIDMRPEHSDCYRTTSRLQVRLCEQSMRSFYGITDRTNIRVITHDFAPTEFVQA